MFTSNIAAAVGTTMASIVLLWAVLRYVFVRVDTMKVAERVFGPARHK